MPDAPPSRRPWSLWDSPRCLHTGSVVAPSDAEGLRACRRCGARDRYPPTPQGDPGKCRPCHRSYVRRRHRERPDIRAREKLERHYRLDREQAGVALVNAQGGLCDACGTLKPLEVDHEHARVPRGNWNAYRSGPARGMLCRSCNGVAGALERGNGSRDPRAPAVVGYLARVYRPVRSASGPGGLD